MNLAKYNLLKDNRVAPLRASIGNSLKLWLDAEDESTLTFNFQPIIETATGTISTNTITASADVSTKLAIGNRIQIAGTDIYTIINIVTDTITTQESLVSNYSADTIEVGHIAQWDDKSGNNNNVIQGISTNQPTFQANVQNNKNVITFDGDDVLRNTSFPDFTTVTIIAVGTYNAGDVTQAMVDINVLGATNTGALLFFGSPGDVTYRSFDGSADNIISSQTLPLTGIFTGITDGTNITFFVNGFQVGQTASGTLTNTLNRVDIGQLGTTPSFSLIGNLVEVMIYNRALAANERTEIQDYLSNKWGIILA